MTDLELQKLLNEVEQDLIEAPPTLKEDVLSHIKEPDKKKEFRIYCTKVMAGMAAAITLLITTPLATNQLGFNPFEDHNGTIVEEQFAQITEKITTLVGGNHHE